MGSRNRWLRFISALTLPTYDTAVGVGMPDYVTYDEKTQTIHLGKGTWSNVSPAVWSYTVGGHSTIKSWVGYRRKNLKADSPHHSMTSSPQAGQPSGRGSFMNYLSL